MSKQPGIKMGNNHLFPLCLEDKEKFFYKKKTDILEHMFARKNFIQYIVLHKKLLYILGAFQSLFKFL